MIVLSSLLRFPDMGRGDSMSGVVVGSQEAQDDAALLSTLGVTAANPDDIERTLLAQVKEKARESQKNFVNLDEEGEAEEQDDYGEDSHTVLRHRLQKQLVALDREIEAVADGAQAFQTTVDEAAAETSGIDRDEEQMLEEKEDENSGGAVLRGAALHHALAKDRLKSLLKKKKDIRAQLRALSKQEQEDADVIRTLVKDTSLVVNAKGKGKKKVDMEAAPSPNPVKKAVSFIEDDDFGAALDAASGLMETERDRLIRTGMLTPFDKVKGFERKVHRVPKAESEDELRARQAAANLASSLAASAMFRPTSRLLDASELPSQEPPMREFRRLRTPLKTVRPESEECQRQAKKKSDKRPKRPQVDKKWRKRPDESDEDFVVDEEDESWSEGEEGRPKKRSRRSKAMPKQDPEDEASAEEEGLNEDDVVLDGGLRIPAKIYNKLFDYQKTGVKWLWELHCQKAGGIIGDEMGLGKTIQVLVFLAGLHNSGMYTPSIVVCPVTLLRQWKREAKKWYPAFNVEILHDSAVASQKSSNKKKRKPKRGSDEEFDEEESDYSENEQEKPVKVKKDRWDGMIDRVVDSSDGIILTTYEQLRIVRDKLLDINWGYAILDEGHRIRNPDAGTTLICKQLQTVHRIIMTGAPIQNRLTELWSLFDFVFPGKLGVLPVFQAQFSLPIAIGGYSNATPLQVSTAYRCAVVLRDLIMPYLLRRMKSDVDAHLPKKTEHVLFCSLTKDQRSAYRAFLASSEVEQIFDGNRNSLFGIDILRKICNHPDLLEREHSAGHPDYGNIERSGKLKVLAQVLELWKTQGHRVLLFTQTQQMLDIVENYVTSKGYVYRRMDGNTPVKQRMQLIDEFNEGDHVFIFILTTKVGGLGTNLIGANRVVIFDPDWNPSTDMQARERAWRIGQKKEVVIYRLITRGTIEEKVYHRQIYKHFLTNKILRDPQQRRFFKARDMRDLFTLQEENAATETSTLFAEVGGSIQLEDEESENVGKDVQDSGSNRRQRGTKKDSQEEALNKHRPEQDNSHNSEDGEPQEEESRILKNLFDANGIHSAMDHDAILGIHESERVMIDHEASRVAERAALALQQSRRLRSADNVSVPTWTGRSGVAGAPATVRQRFGSTANARLVASSSQGQTRSEESGNQPAIGISAGSSAGRAFTSADLLARVRERKLDTPGTSGSVPNASPSTRPTTSRPPSGPGRNGEIPVQPEVLIRQLCTFIQREGGSVASSHVVNQFRDRKSVV